MFCTKRRGATKYVYLEVWGNYEQIIRRGLMLWLKWLWGFCVLSIWMISVRVYSAMSRIWRWKVTMGPTTLQQSASVHFARLLVTKIRNFGMFFFLVFVLEAHKYSGRRYGCVTSSISLFAVVAGERALWRAGRSCPWQNFCLILSNFIFKLLCIVN